MRRPSSVAESQQKLRHANRRGALFHYYMMYLFLSSVLLTTSGMCIHVVLKADSADAKIALDLKTLLRLEERLRGDAVQSAGLETREDGFEFSHTAGARQFRWSVNKNALRREDIENGDMVASERFVFSRGTTFEFATDAKQFVVTLWEPPFGVPQVSDAEKSPTVKPVRMIIIVPDSKTAKGEK